MSSNDSRKNYRDLAIETFFSQEHLNKAEYQKVFENLARFFVEILPEMKLYRYRSNLKWKYTAPIIEKNQVYLCPLDRQNDPFEFAFNDDFGEIVKQVPTLQGGTNISELNYTLAFQDKWKDKCEEIHSYKAKMSIACFCEEKDNMLLWAHYANSNQGICIEYSAIDLLEQFQCFLLPVIYQEELPALPSIREINMLSPYKMVFERISTKSKKWCYENEWRIIRHLETSDNHLVDFPKPTAIFLGTNASKALENKVLDICVKKKINLCKMKPDRYSYSLKSESIYSVSKGAINNGQAEDGNP